MKFKSAFDDFRETTLEAIAGCLRRLDYLSGLRDKTKQEDYAHWGLTRIYGDLQSRRALTQAHRTLVSEVLSTPIPKLLEDAERSSEIAGVQPDAYLERLSQRGVNLLPAAPGAGSARHLNSVLNALLGLVKNRKQNAIRRVS
jgi:hypothetical protein